ncbi:MAG: mechanosensitive ion channel family protein [Saprospiraceae bacterium]|nr:mechanosensitive ion channel family protein [Saprospiraceae bacterium]
MNITNIIYNLLMRFVAAVPNIVAAILVIIIGMLISKIVYKFIIRLFKATSIDSLKDKLNEIEFLEKANIELLPSEIIAKVIYYILILIFGIAATDLLGMPELSKLVSDLINYMPKLISAGVMLLIGILLCEAIRKMVASTCKSLGIASGNIISSFIFYFLLITVVLSSLTQMGIDTEFMRSNITIILGGVVLAFSIGYGFASRDLLANFLASFYSKEKFKEGDIISISGYKGTVIQKDNNSIYLLVDSVKVIIPLSKATTETIEVYYESENTEDEHDN